MLRCVSLNRSIRSVILLFGVNKLSSLPENAGAAVTQRCLSRLHRMFGPKRIQIIMSSNKSKENTSNNVLSGTSTSMLHFCFFFLLIMSNCLMTKKKTHTRDLMLPQGSVFTSAAAEEGQQSQRKSRKPKTRGRKRKNL